MKRILASIAAAAIVLSIGSAGVFAASQNCKANYIDANGDGICDNFEVRNNGGGRIRGKRGNTEGTCNSGVCVNSAGSNQCTGFTDADNDGTCDNKPSATGGNRRHDGTGAQNARRGGCR